MRTVTVVVVRGYNGTDSMYIDGVWLDEKDAEAYAAKENTGIDDGNALIAPGWGNPTYYEVYRNVRVKEVQG